MIFTIGFTLALMGYALYALYGTGYKYTKNNYDYAGYFVGGIGAALVLLSLATLTWKYLP